MLIQDPPSINWNNPVLPANILKNMLSTCVAEMAKNRDVKFLFHLNWEEEDKKLMESMAAAEPMAPRILNDLYMKSPTGQRLGFLATFSNMRSTQLALGDQHKAEAVKKIRSSEQLWLKHIEKILYAVKKTKARPFKRCMTEFAQQLRDRSWFPNGDRTVVGVTVPHPMERI